jgi:uncharacterized protein involved in outer membrane biogenesis
MKWLKVFFSILGLLLLICVLAVGSLIVFLDPNKLKPAIIDETMKQTGYQLTIAGPLSWSFYPGLAIKIDSMTFSTPNRPIPFIELHDVRVLTEWWPLLRGHAKWQGKVSISAMKLMNLHAKNMTADLHWDNHGPTLRPIHALLYGGSLTGALVGHDLSGVPHWQWDVQFSDIQLWPLLQNVNGPESKIKVSGVGQVKLQGETQGKTQNQILNNMNGTGEFSLHDGIVQGVDLNYLMQTADALINKQAVTPSANREQTSFSRLTGPIVIKNGVAETNNMLLVSSAFITKGEGTVVLLSKELNFHLLVGPQQNAKTQWEIPVLVTGDLGRPDVRLDMTEIEKFLAKQEWGKLKAKAVEQIKEHVPGKAGEFLQNLLSK